MSPLKSIILILLIVGIISLAGAGYMIYNEQISKIKGLSEDLERTHQSLKTTESELSEINRQKTNLITKTKELKERINLGELRIMKSEWAKEDFEREKNTLYKENEKLKNILTKAKESLNEQIILSELKKKELEKDFQDELESEKEIFYTEKAVLSKQIKSAEAARELLTAKNKELLSELDKSNQMLVELNTHEASKNLGKIKKELKDKISELNKAIKENKELTTQLTKSKEIISRLTDTTASGKKSTKRQKKPGKGSKEEALKFHYNRGLTYDKNHQYKEAVAEYKKALRIAPDDPDIHYNLGIIYDEHLNNKRKAVKHYEAYLRLSPGAEDIDKVAHWISKARQDLKWGKSF